MSLEPNDEFGPDDGFESRQFEDTFQLFTWNRIRQ